MRNLFPFKGVVPYNPHGNKLVANPSTLGDKLRNRRVELGLSQSQVAKIFKADSDLVCMWEKNIVKPTIKRYPQVINFLGYFPFDVDRTTIGGKIKLYRYTNGLSQEEMAIVLDLNECSVRDYERGGRKPFKSTESRIRTMLNG
jgi:transcriptional regulator with XRE-family HTH domain